MLSTLTPRRELWLLFTLAGIQFTHILDFMIMMPLGPQFTQLFGVNDAQFGLLVSAYTFAAGASGLLASTYVDRFGRKRLLLVLYTLFAVATLACGLAPTYEVLLGARVAAGVFGGVLSALSQTIVADVVPFERRGRAMGVVMTSFSVSSVAGVPLGLFLAAHLNWHAPFFAIAALCGVLGVIAAVTMPMLNAHLHALGRVSPFEGIRQVLTDTNHLRAFAFSALMMFSSFTVIPYLTLYLQANVGLSQAQIPYIYLCGGVVSLLSARLFGQMTDRNGKVVTFRVLALLVTIPMLSITLLPSVPLGVVLVVSSLLFLCTSGRMIPGMAIVTSAANPALRGTFMTLNSSIQSAAMGVATFAGGLVIERDTQGAIHNYWVAALMGMAGSLAACWMAGRLRLYGATPETR